ncbi:MAG: DUF2190 family protein [Candidatus Jettenia sp.]|uniref:Uncharacterized protein n=1 Tax=Candidatus Jettenia caeni TaxID=247490 RepID=I3IN03_9BACT|nr:DUF2190 family protein [Candidatus Jettenia sp. AMX1]MBC6928652.1 DUF2190 family protein [Candidatus Jettenia sp.]GAB63098.1 hypothetical protein KSU1_C1502 [Candidatus Jettenia caeni]KAA0250630.1 MAG: DUF2190 family protein [Candidatus Jettenia sp. AMX1]MCE7879964.1 DUF2190 family protein [Candidatus Jettenia sp. AMX1]MCQ3926746.1 DUF2190 family protein [Candidatus Jettenia sp.]
MANKVREDLLRIRTIKYKHTSATTKDTIYILGGRPMLAVNSEGANTSNIYVIAGLIEYAKTSAQAWTAGQAIFWDAVNSVFTTTPGGNTYAGVAAEDAANPSSAGFVVLLPFADDINSLMKKASATAINTSGAGTYSAANIVNRVILRDPNGADRTDTTATAAEIVAAVVNPAVGACFILAVRNTADADGEIITVAGGANVTLTGYAKIARGNVGLFLVVLTNVTASSETVTIYRLGEADMAGVGLGYDTAGKLRIKTGYTPTHIAVFAGTSAAENDVDATVVITVTGALATDVASVVLRAAANDVYIKKAVLTSNTLTVTLSGNGGSGTEVDYVVFRAVA